MAPARPPHDRDADSAHALADRLRRPRHDRAARAARRAAGRSRPGSSRRATAPAAYEFLRERLREGRQAFVVCPLVAESEKTARQGRRGRGRAAAQRTSCATSRVGVLHGQMPLGATRREAMEAFASGETDVLVATTVIEVGIDVPNATVMVIEGAERYGVSQLHQLRGRVGRGEHASHCLLFADRRRRDWPGAGWRRSPASATASSSPRSTSACAARARCSAPASTACRASPSPSCRRTRRCCSRPARRCWRCCARHGSLADPALGPAAGRRPPPLRRRRRRPDTHSER